MPLSLAALEWLQELGPISTWPGSPLASVLSPMLRTAPEERSVAGSLLIVRGLVKTDLQSTHQSIQLVEGFREAMKTLAQPDLGICISISATAQKSLTAHYFIAGQNLVLAASDRLLFYAGWPIRTDVFVTALAQLLKSEEAKPKPVRMLPFQARSSSLIWKKFSRKVTDEIPRELAIDALLQNGISAREAHIAIEGLFRTGFIRCAGSNLALQPEYRDALEVLWSGHRFAIDRVSFQGPTTDSKVSRLLFIGPPGKRMLCRSVVLPLNPRNRQARTNPRHNGALLMDPVDGDFVQGLIRRFLSASDLTTLSAARSAQSGPTKKPEPSSVRTCSCVAPTGSRKFCTKCGKPRRL